MNNFSCSECDDFSLFKGICQKNCGMMIFHSLKEFVKKLRDLLWNPYDGILALFMG